MKARTIKTAMLAAPFVGWLAWWFYFKSSSPVGTVTVEEIPNAPELQILSPILETLEKMGLPIQPRGIRNNNPGNIRFSSATAWKGQTGTDGAFCIFDSPEFGIRALNRILNSYASRGVDTVREVIYTWAPPIENDSAAYMNAVAKACGVSVDQVPQRIKLVKAIIQHENGTQPYTDQQIVSGMYAV